MKWHDNYQLGTEQGCESAKVNLIKSRSVLIVPNVSFPKFGEYKPLNVSAKFNLIKSTVMLPSKGFIGRTGIVSYYTIYL